MRLRTRALIGIGMATCLAWSPASPGPLPPGIYAPGLEYGTATPWGTPGIPLSLTGDYYVPFNPNGATVVWIVSGGWTSLPLGSLGYLERVDDVVLPLLQNGYTVFAVHHGDVGLQTFTIGEIASQVTRALQYARWTGTGANPDMRVGGLDPNRIGVLGLSSGGHLAALAATHPVAGIPGSTDPVAQQPSAVQAVFDFFGPMNMQTWAGGPSIYQGVYPLVHAAFPNLVQLDQEAAAVSPMVHLDPTDPPHLILTGSTDIVVPPFAQSVPYAVACQQQGVVAELLVQPGEGHVFSPEAMAGSMALVISRADMWLLGQPPGGPPAGVFSYGSGTPSPAGATAVLSTSGPAQGGAPFTLDISSAPPNTSGWLLFSTGLIPAGIQVLGAVVHVDPSRIILVLPVCTDGTGSARIPLSLPPGFAGFQFNVQYLGANAPGCSPIPDPGNGLNASQALGLTLQPE
jgi:hypothetical protein